MHHVEVFIDKLVKDDSGKVVDVKYAVNVTVIGVESKIGRLTRQFRDRPVSNATVARYLGLNN